MKQNFFHYGNDPRNFIRLAGVSVCTNEGPVTTLETEPASLGWKGPPGPPLEHHGPPSVGPGGFPNPATPSTFSGPSTPTFNPPCHPLNRPSPGPQGHIPNYSGSVGPSSSQSYGMPPNSFTGPSTSGPPSVPFPGSPAPSNASTPGPGGISPFPQGPGGGPPTSSMAVTMSGSGPLASPMPFACSSAYSSPTHSAPHMNGTNIGLGGSGHLGPMGPMGPMNNGPPHGHPGAFPGGFSGPGGPFGPGGPPFMPGGPGGGPPMHGPMHGPGHPMMATMGPLDRIEQGRRHTPYFGQPDYRLYELNKRLQQRTEDSDNLWWDAFATEFFEDDASLTLTFCLEDGPKRYTIGRTLIPRYFRSIFDGGVTDLYYTLKHPRESFHNTSITLECECCTMVTHHGKPMYTKVCTEGKLILEFTFDDLMRIKSWHFAVRGHRELIPRTVIMQQDPSMVETLGKNITRQGLTTQTLNYLRLCVILEPMQELMSRHKAYALSPRDCLKTTLFQKWQRMIAPPGGAAGQGGRKNGAEKSETQRAPNKRRKRKGSQSGQNANSSSTGTGKKRSPGPNYNLASQVSDVMVVGEPSLMGGEFGDEDERLITRLENSQYDTPSVDEGGGSVGGPNPGGPSNGPQGGPQSGGQPGGPGQVPPGGLGAPGGPSGGGGPTGPTSFSNSPMTAGGPAVGGGPWPEPRQPQDVDKKSPAISH